MLSPPAATGYELLGGYGDAQIAFAYEVVITVGRSQRNSFITKAIGFLVACR